MRADNDDTQATAKGPMTTAEVIEYVEHVAAMMHKAAERLEAEAEKMRTTS